MFWFRGKEAPPAMTLRIGLHPAVLPAEALWVAARTTLPALAAGPATAGVPAPAAPHRPGTATPTFWEPPVLRLRCFPHHRGCCCFFHHPGCCSLIHKCLRPWRCCRYVPIFRLRWHFHPDGATALGTLPACCQPVGGGGVAAVVNRGLLPTCRRRWRCCCCRAAYGPRPRR